MKNFSLIIKKYFQILLITAFSAVMILPVQMVNAEERVEILNVKAGLTKTGAIEIEWITNPETTGKVIFGETSDNLNRYVAVNTASKYNKVEIGGLKEKTTYYYQIIVYRNLKESARSFVNKIKTDKVVDLSPPVVEDLNVPFIGGSVAVVSWHTDEDSTSAVEYSLDQSYSGKANVNSKVKEHAVALKKLIPDRRYYIRAYSVDASGSKSDYVYKVFYTLKNITHDYDGMEISYLRPSGPDDIYITQDSITASFKTNRFAKGEAVLKKAKSKNQVININYGMEHRAVFYDLEPDTTYVLAISMDEPLGGKAKAELTIKTKKKKASPVLSADGGVAVAGIEHSYYTPAQFLYKAEDSSRVFAILNGKKHYIASPSAFDEYGYEWKMVKTVNQKKLSNIPRVKLVKSPESSTVYYLYERSGGRLLKLNLPSPGVFESYPANKWGDIVSISQIDIASYPDVNLIKAEGGSQIYYIEKNIKHSVSSEVFKAKGFNPEYVATVNKKHFDSYQEGYPLK